MQSSDKILTRNFVLLFAGNFIIVSTYFLLMTTMALYALNNFGVDSATAGVTASIFLVGGVIGRIVCGRYSAQWGLKRMTMVALVIQIAACLLYFADALGVGFLIAVRLMHGFSFGIANTTIPAMAVEALPPRRIGEGTGYFMLSNSLGVGIGPMMSILLVMGVDYQVLFRICTVLAVVVLVVSAGVQIPELRLGTRMVAKGQQAVPAAAPGAPAGVGAQGVPARGSGASDGDATAAAAGDAAGDAAPAASAGVAEGRVAAQPAAATRAGSGAPSAAEGVRGALDVPSPPCAEGAPAPAAAGGAVAAFVRSVLDTSTVRVSFFMFLVAFAYSSVNSFVSSYAASIGMSAYAPFVFMVYSVTLIVTRLFTGKLMDKYGENVVLYPSIASMIVGLLLVGFAANPVMLMSCGAFMATGFGTCMSVGQAVATRETKSGNTALAISTFFLLCDGGCGVGPFFLGFVVDAAGYRAMYVVCAVISALAVAYYHFAHGRQARAARLTGAAGAAGSAGVESPAN